MTSREQALLERMELVQDAAGIGIFDDDLFSDQLDWDVRMRALWGIGPEAPVTRQFFIDSLHPEDRERARRAFEAACDPAGSRRLACEYRIIRADGGGIRHLACTGIVKFEGDRPVGLVGSVRDVTEAREAERQRREVESLAEALLATAPTFIYIYDLVAQRNIYLSPQGMQTLDFDRATLDAEPGNLMEALMHPDDQARIAAHQQAIRDGTAREPFQIEVRIRHRDGHYLWISSKEVVHRRDAEGRPTQILGASLDVTALKETEEAAHANARLLQALMDAVPSLLFAKDRDGRYTLANEATLKVIGRPWAEVKGRTDADWTPEDQLALIRAVDAQVMVEGRTLENEEPFFHDEQGPRLYLTRKTPLHDGEGQISGLVGSAIDITDRVRATNAVAASEAQLRLVLDQLIAFVGVAAPDGTLLFANRAPLELAGLSPPDVLGRPFWEAHWWSYDPAAKERVRATMAAAAAGETVRYDIPALFAGDRPQMIDFQVAPVRGADGEVLYLIPSGLLIEDRIEAERGRELLIGELNHRIKNLYAIVIAMLERTARTEADKDRLVATVSGRLQAMARAHDLVRPPAAGEREAIGLADLVETVLRPHTAAEAQLQLTADSCQVAGRAITPMALILHELATNAAKYGALSRPDGQIALDCRRHNGAMHLKWRERGGPLIGEPPGRHGFGSQLMRIAAEAQLGGRIAVEWPPEGCAVTLEVPLSQLGG